MLIRTHIAITLCFVLIFLSNISDKFIFVLVALVATLLPDIDSRFSIIGRKKISRILQLFTKHRGIMHSFSFLFGVTFILVLFWPVASLGFFLGYGLHLLADGFTVHGIAPFYPSRKKIRGKIRTGEKSEVIVLVVFVILDLFLFLREIF